MKKKLTAIALLLVLLVSGCKKEEKVTSTAQPLSVSKEEYPKVDGSTATLPFSQAVYRLLTGANKYESEQAIEHYKTTNSYIRLIDKEVDLLIVAEPNEKVFSYIEETGVKITMKPIALDAFVFLCNEDNPVKSLTPEELVNIYSGKTRNWSELGGRDQEILAFQRNENAGSQTMMENLVMKDVPMMEAPRFRIETMADLVDQVASYNNESNALGYSVFYYANLMYQQPGLRFMAINDVQPTKETIQNSTYPFITTYYAVVREEEPKDSKAHQIFDWLTSTEAQQLATSLGYVSTIAEDGKGDEMYTSIGKLTDQPLPISEEERIMLFPEPFTVQLIDKNCNITNTFYNVSNYNQEYEYDPCIPVETRICNINEPLILRSGITYEGKESERTYGLYDLKQKQWIIPYQEGYIEKIAEGMYHCGNKIVDVKGTVLFEAKEAFSVLPKTIYVQSKDDIIANELKSFEVFEKGEDSFQYIRATPSGNYVIVDDAVYTYKDELCFNRTTFFERNNMVDKSYLLVNVEEVLEDQKKAIVKIVEEEEKTYITDLEGKIIEELKANQGYIEKGEFYTVEENTITITNIATGSTKTLVSLEGKTIPPKNVFIGKMGNDRVAMNYYIVNIMSMDDSRDLELLVGDTLKLYLGQEYPTLYQSGYLKYSLRDDGTGGATFYNNKENKVLEIEHIEEGWIVDITDQLVIKKSGGEFQVVTIEDYKGTIYYRQIVVEDYEPDESNIVE